MDLRPIRLNLRRAGLALLPVSLGAAALIYTLRNFDAASFRGQVEALDWRWVGFAVAMDVASYFLQGIRWSLLLRPLRRVGPLTATRAIYAGLFVNEVVPMRPGEVLRGLAISRESQISIAGVGRTILAERAMDGFWLFTATLLVSAFVPLPDYIRRALPYAYVGIGVIAALGFAVSRTRWRGWLESLRNEAALVSSLGVLVAQGLAMWAAIKACNLPVPVLAGSAIMLIVRIGTLVPGAPANLGTHQLSTVFGLSLFGVAQIEATSAAFLIFAILTIPLLLLGLAAVAATGASWGNLSPETHERATQC